MSLSTTIDTEQPVAVPARATRAPVSLVARLGSALEAADVRYCQWKGHGKTARWTSGDGDIDLLVDRVSAPAFARTLEALGFKPAIASPATQVPGVVSWLGFDPALGRLIHIHVHYKLILGRAETRHYHLAIERAVHNSALQRLCFKTPAPELELILFVLQQTLRHDPLVAPGTSQERVALLQGELRRLEGEADPAAVIAAVGSRLPEVGIALFERCLAALRPAASHVNRILARRALARRLAACAHGGGPSALLRRVVRRIARAIGPNNADSGKRLVAGGSVIALLGADGAGKSTCARELVNWLGTELKTCHAHLGRPPRSASTMLAGGALKVAQRLDRLRRRAHPSSLAAHLELLRHVCTGRDRWLLHRRMRRFAAAGGIAICERYPTPENAPLAGPSKARGVALDAQSRLARGLRKLEAWWYRGISQPDQTLVLRVEPELAVRRKTTEPEDYVRARARRMWETDWSRANADVIDAGRPLEEVLADLRATVWAAL